MIGKKKSARRVRPEAWAYVDTLGKALERAESVDGGARIPLKPGDVIVTTESIQQLGRALREIAHGADPRNAFPTKKKAGNQSDAPFITTRTLIYYRARALGRSKSEAAELARRHFGELLPAPSAETIVRQARRFRDRALKDVVGLAIVLPSGEKESCPTRAQVDALRERLEKHGEGDWGD